MLCILLRLLALPAAVLVGLALAAAEPVRSAGAESESEADVLAAADDPKLTAANRELAFQLDLVDARIALRDEVAERLVAGRLGLADAADEFLRLSESAPDCLAVMRSHFPAADDRESAACSALEYARLRTPAAEWPAVRERLAGEYRAAFHHGPR